LVFFLGVTAFLAFLAAFFTVRATAPILSFIRFAIDFLAMANSYRFDLERFFADLLLDFFCDLTARLADLAFADFFADLVTLAVFFAFLVTLAFFAVPAFRPTALAALLGPLAARAFFALPFAAASFTAATACLRRLGARFLIACFAPSAKAFTAVEASSAAASAATSVT
jgi:hypothetical protein